MEKVFKKFNLGILSKFSDGSWNNRDIKWKKLSTIISGERWTSCLKEFRKVAIPKKH